MSVKDTIAKAKALDVGQKRDLSKKILSTNAVTGYSVNFPIYGTCLPSKVCIKNCYAGAKNKPITFKSALSKQVELLNAVKESPYLVAEKIISEVNPLFLKGKLKFLRWNGVGDLFDESITCLVHIAESLPNLPIWVVTRKPKLASKVPNLPNIFLHFSLDSESLDRYDQVMKLDPLNENLFFSYTGDTGELAPPEKLKEIPISVFYTDLYKNKVILGFEEVSCPLNGNGVVENACESCGRCWSKQAVDLKQLVDFTPPKDTPEELNLFKGLL